MDRRAFLSIGIFPSILTGMATPTLAQSAPPSISVHEAHARARAGTSVLVDIRTPQEWADTGVAEGAVRLDMETPGFEIRLAGIRAENPGKPIDLICRTANRTRQVQEALTKRGWRDLVNVRGGMLGNPADKGWLDEKLPVVSGK